MQTHLISGYTKLAERSGSILQMNEELDVGFRQCSRGVTIMTLVLCRLRKRSMLSLQRRRREYLMLSVYWIRYGYDTFLRWSCSAYSLLNLALLTVILRLPGQQVYQRRQNIGSLETVST